jgi:hypothetical protein
MYIDKADKRKRETNSDDVAQSLSQLSLSRQHLNKRQRAIAAHGMNVNGGVLVRKDSTLDYLNVSDSVFQRMLSTSMEGAEAVVDLLNATSQLQIARQYAYFINDVLFLKMKQEYWNQYYTMVIIEQIGLMPMAKNMTHGNHIAHCHFKTKVQIEYIRQKLIEQITQKEHDLHRFEQQMINKFPLIDRLSMVITAFVRKGQHKLHAEYERRKKRLELNVQDYRLVRSFVALNPNASQVKTKGRIMFVVI